MKNKLILKRIGLNNPTMVECNGKILVTQGLDIEQLCNTWRSYFGINLGIFGGTNLYIENEKDFNSMSQRTLKDSKSVKELFAEQGFECKLLPKGDKSESEWVLCHSSQIQHENNKIEPKEFTEQEKAVIRALDKLKWVVKDKDGFVWGHIKKPDKLDSCWSFGRGIRLSALTSCAFKAIKWEDDEPTSREEILGDEK